MQPHKSFFLVVKGPMPTAIREAHARGIDFEADAINGPGTETYGYAPIADRAKIIDWYCEDNGFAQIAPVGSLLWYAEREEKGNG